MADVNANIGVNIDTSAALAQLKALQRQISQFHTSIAKSSESAALAQRDLQKNFLNSVNAIGSFSAELRTVKTTAESFTDSLQKNKFSMREYFRFAGGSTKTFGKLFKSEFDTIGKVAEDRVKRLQTQYIKLGRDTSGAMKAIAIMPNQLDMSNFSTQSQMAAQKQAIFNQLVKQGSTNLLNFGKNTQWAGRQLMVGFTLPLMALGTAATRTFMEMEAQTIKFRKVYGDLFTPTEETTQALDNITALGQMFTQYGIAVSQTVGLAAEAAAAGFSGVDLQRQTTEATRLSILGQVDAQKALETTISLQNAFRMSSDQLASSIDFLNAVENQTVVSLDDITTAIPKVAPVIEQLGGDVKDLAFFMAAMKEGGINASEGANALKSGLAALINPTDKASAMLAGYGINIKKIIEGNQGDLKTTVVEFAQALDTLDPLTRARAIEQLFGKFQFARLSTLFTNVINETGQASRVLDLAGTSIEELAALSESELGMTADSAMNKFRKSVEDLKFALVPVGQTFMQAVTPILEFVGGIVEKFNNLSTGVKKAIVVLTVAIGAIGPVALMAFGLLANGLANIVKGAMVLRNGYLRLTGQTQILGEQTEYLTMEQIDAAAASHSLDQSHARLTQTFTAESSAVAQLIAAYQQATAAAAKFAAVNPGMMRAPGGAPTKRAKGKPVVVGGTGNQDTELALLTPGETVIPAEMSKKYGALINGMIAGNIPGYKTGRGSLGSGDAEFAMSIAAGAQQRSQAKIREFLEKELKAVPEALVQDFKSLVTTASQEIQLSEKSLKERLKAFRAQYNANIGQQEELQFAHLDTGRRVAAGPLLESGAVVDPRTQARLKQFVDAAGAEALVDLKTGFGLELTGFLNNAMQGAGASLQDVLTDFEIGGVEKFRQSVEMGGGNMEQLGDELVAFDTRFQQNLQEAYDNGARIIVDSQAQIEQMRQEALAKGEAFDDTVYVAMDTVAQQTRENVLKLGNGLDAVFEEAINRVTEIRYQGLTPDQQAALPAGYGRGSKGGRITPGGTSYGRGKKVVGDFRNAPLAQESAANVNAAIAATAQAAGTQSPSRKTIPIGEDIARGLEVGMDNRKDDVAMAGQELATAAVAGTQSGRARRAAFREEGAPTPTLTETGTQSGGPRVRRRSGRPEASSELTLEEARQSAMSKATKDAADKEITARKTSAQRLDSMNKGLMAGTFALTSLAGAGSMASGPLGNLSQQVMKYSGLLFALMSVTQLLTQAKVTELVATRASAAAGLMQGLGKDAAGKQIGAKVSTLFTKGGGLAGFKKNLLTAGKFLFRFAGPVGLVTTGLIGLYSITKIINAEREKERLAIEGLGDAATLSADKIKNLGEFFNVVPTQTKLERTGPSLILNNEKRSQVDQLRATESFQKDFGKDIKALQGTSDAQAKLIFNSLAIQLKGKGFAKENIDTIIKALQEESGKTNIKFDFANIDIATEKGRATLQRTAVNLGNSFGKQFSEGYSEEIKTGFNRATGQIITYTEKTLSKGLQKSVATTSKVIAGMFNGLSGQIENGSITAAQFNESFAAISKTIENMPEPQAMFLLDNILKNMPGDLAKTAIGIKNVSDQFLIAQAAMLGVSTITAAMVKQLKAASESSDGGAARAANRVRAKIKSDVSAVQELFDLVKAETDKINKGTGTGKKEDSPFALAVKQLQNQQAELKNTTTAYNMLKKAGFDSATALEYAKDSVIALGLATGTIKPEQLETIKTLMIDIEKRSSSAAIRDFLTSLRDENTLKESFSGIIPSLLAMGATFEDIETIVNNPTLMNSFVDKSVTVEDRTRRIKEYLDAIRTGEAIDININLQTPEGIQKEFDKRKSAAMEYYDVLEREIQDRFEEPIKAAEKAAADAADNVKKIQDEIDGLQSTIATKQRNIELTINRPIEELQQSINDLQRKIEMEFDRPLGLLQDESSRLSEDLTIMDKAAEGINAKYDAQAAALEKVSEINQDIIGQQKQQIGLADALTQGDISAAANAAQEMRASRAEAASRGAGDVIQAAREAELGAQRSPGGLTRDQIAQRQYQIERQSYALSTQRKVVEDQILVNQDKIYALEQKRIPLLAEITKIEDDILLIQNGRLAKRQEELEAAESALEATKKELQAELDTIDAQRERWEDAQLAIDLAKVKGKEFQDQLIASEKVAKGISDKWNDIKSKSVELRITEVRTVIINEIKGTTVQKAYGGKIKKMAAGGVVPGTGLTDKVPALLTPGEFVINKESTKAFGPLLNKINESKFPSFLNAGYSQEKYSAEPSLFISAPSRTSVNTISDNSNTVYNYSVGITVGGSSATPDTIAKAVLGEIKYIDSQRIRGQR